MLIDEKREIVTVVDNEIRKKRAMTRILNILHHHLHTYMLMLFHKLQQLVQE